MQGDTHRSFRFGLPPFALALAVTIALPACDNDAPPRVVENGDPESGKLMLDYYQCGTCHRIPGIKDAEGVVGPPLDAYGRRGFIAGTVANNADNLVQWLVDPQSIRPNTAMPDVGVTEPEARDMAAYLYTLK